jgi:6-phosphogluconolactonase (cycloisomerase 2 family)
MILIKKKALSTRLKVDCDFSQGSGPRHFVFSHDGSKLYVINELGSLFLSLILTINWAYLVQELPTVRSDFIHESYCAIFISRRTGNFFTKPTAGKIQL